MIAVMTIARYELARRRMLFLGALVLGFVPVVLARTSEHTDQLVWTSDHSDLTETCLLGVVVLSWIVAFATGMSLLGRPLHDGRLSFYFTRPMRGSAIAAGKVVGGLAAVVAMELMLLVPLIGSDTLLVRDNGAWVPVAMAAMFLAAGLVVGILARSRSRWFIVDALGATCASLLAMAMFARINDLERQAIDARLTFDEAHPLWEHADVLVRVVFVGALAAVFVGVIVAIAIGRTDRERVHRALAITLWSGVVATAAAGLAFAHWGLS